MATAVPCEFRGFDSGAASKIAAAQIEQLNRLHRLRCGFRGFRGFYPSNAWELSEVGVYV